MRGRRSCSIVSTFRPFAAVQDNDARSFPWRTISLREHRRVSAVYADRGVLRALVTPAILAVDLLLVLSTQGNISYAYGTDYRNLQDDLGRLPFPFALGPSLAVREARQTAGEDVGRKR